MGNPSDATYELDSRGLSRYNLQASTWWAAGWSTRGEQLTYPGRHGNAAPAKPAVWDPQPLQLDMLLQKPTQEELQAAMTELTGLVAAGGVRELWRVSAGEWQSQPCRVVSFQPGEFVVGSHAQVSVTVELMGPFWRPWNARQHSLPAGTSTLPREGTAPVTDAVVRFTGPSSGAHTVTEGIWDTGVTWTGTILQGQYLFIDPQTMRAWMGQLFEWDDWSSARDVSTGLAPATAGPLSLHHTTGWGQGAETDRNRYIDPFHERGGHDGSVGGKASTDETMGRRDTPSLKMEVGPGDNHVFSWNSVPVSSGIGERIYASFWVRWDSANQYKPWFWIYGSGVDDRVSWKPTAAAEGDTWHRVTISSRISTAGTATLYGYLGDSPTEVREGDRMWLDDVYLGTNPRGTAFSGDMWNTDELVYEWTGTRGQSPSTVGPRVLTRSTPITASKAATLRFKEAWL